MVWSFWYYGKGEAGVAGCRNGTCLFWKETKRAIERYASFVENGISHGKRPDLAGGGLIRGLGGWSQVLSLRRVGSKVFSDERILGSSEFVKEVIADAGEKAKETLRLTLKRSDLPSLALEVCEGGRGT